MAKVFDKSGYSGLLSCSLQRNNLGEYKLFKKKTNRRLIKNPFNKNHIQQEISSHAYALGKELNNRSKTKRLCPLLERFRSHFMDQSIIHQPTQSVMPGESLFEGLSNDNQLKTADKLLEEFDVSLLNDQKFEEGSIIEELERNISVYEDEEEMEEMIQEDYEVENFSEQKKLREEIDQDQSLNSTVNRRQYTGYSQYMGSTQSQRIKMDVEANILSEEFEYWSCIEPEKWKMKKNKIKSIKR